MNTKIIVIRLLLKKYSANEDNDSGKNDADNSNNWDVLYGSSEKWSNKRRYWLLIYLRVVILEDP